MEIVEDIYYKLITRYQDTVYDITRKKVDVENISFIGLPDVLDHPFMRKDRIAVENGQEMPNQFSDKIYVNACKDIVSVEQWSEMRKAKVPFMEDLLKSLPKPTEGNKVIYVLHDPPYNVGLDNCKDGDKPGSKAIAKFLEESNSYMSFHGHIHESPKISGVWHTKIGNTICIQPGQTEFEVPELHYVLVDTDTNTFERFIK